MTEIGDRLREYAMLCDAQPKIVAAGVIVRPNETVVAAFTEIESMDVQAIAIGFYNAVITPPDESMFREVDEPEPRPS